MIDSNWAGYSSGSDDDECVAYKLKSPVSAPSESKSDHNEGTVFYPIKMVDHKNTYANILYDVEGTPLKSPFGEYLNVKSKAMKTAIDNKALRVIHCLKEPSYWYFITSPTQLTTFRTHRDNGAPKTILYHVYVDDDVDRSSHEYKQLFVSRYKPKQDKAHKRG